MAARQYTSRPLAERFWSKVDRSGGPDACWLWTGGKVGGTAYGKIQGEGGKHGKHLRAHRLSWKLAHGPIPDGMHVLHRCDNPPCVNPEHLFLGSDADNVADMQAKGRFGKNAATKTALAHADEIRRLYQAEGRTQSEIAAALGISQATVSRHLIAMPSHRRKRNDRPR